MKRQTMTYRTYKTEAGAQRYADKLAARWPGREFRPVMAPDASFRYAVAYVPPAPRDNYGWPLCG